MSDGLLHIGDTIKDEPAFAAPEGDYRFKVLSWTKGSFTPKSPDSKIPACDTLDMRLAVPYRDAEGEVQYGVTTYRMKMVERLSFVLAQFFEGVGVMREFGSFRIDPDGAVGREGVCHIIRQIGSTGNEFSSVQSVYTPSKRPLATDNDGMPYERPLGDDIQF